MVFRYVEVSLLVCVEWIPIASRDFADLGCRNASVGQRRDRRGCRRSGQGNQQSAGGLGIKDQLDLSG
jgi:hypothetical protein